MPVRRPLPAPVVVPRSSYSSPRHDYGIDESISQVGYLSNAVLDDTYDAAVKSKNRDNELIRNTRAAIISTEQHVSPRAASVSRRVRGGSVAPAPGRQMRAASLPPARVAPPSGGIAKVASPRPRVVVLPPNPRVNSFNPASSKPVVLVRGGSLPPPPAPRGVRAGSLPPRPRAVPKQQGVVLPTATLWAHRPVPLRKNIPRRASYAGPSYRSERDYMEDVDTLYSPVRNASPVLQRRQVRAASEPMPNDLASDYYFSIPPARGKYITVERARVATKPKKASLVGFPQVYVPSKGPGPSNRAKAAIIGSRMEADDAAKGKPPRRPRSQFAANKLREFKIQDMERKYK